MPADVDDFTANLCAKSQHGYLLVTVMIKISPLLHDEILDETIIFDQIEFDQELHNNHNLKINNLIKLQYLNIYISNK